MVGLYLLGILVGIFAAVLYKTPSSRARRSLGPGAAKLPAAELRSVLQLSWEKSKDFLQRAFTVIFLATIVIPVPVTLWHTHFNLDGGHPE